MHVGIDGGFAIPKNRPKITNKPRRKIGKWPGRLGVWVCGHMRAHTCTARHSRAYPSPQVRKVSGPCPHDRMSPSLRDFSPQRAQEPVPLPEWAIYPLEREKAGTALPGGPGPSDDVTLSAPLGVLPPPAVQLW